MQTTNLFIVSDLDPHGHMHPPPGSAVRQQLQPLIDLLRLALGARLRLGVWVLPLVPSIYRGVGDCVRGRQVNFTRAGGGAVAVPCLRTLPITTHDRIVGRYAVAYTAYPVDPPLRTGILQ